MRLRGWAGSLEGQLVKSGETKDLVLGVLLAEPSVSLISERRLTYTNQFSFVS